MHPRCTGLDVALCFRSKHLFYPLHSKWGLRVITVISDRWITLPLIYFNYVISCPRVTNLADYLFFLSLSLYVQAHSHSDPWPGCRCRLCLSRGEWMPLKHQGKNKTPLCSPPLTLSVHVCWWWCGKWFTALTSLAFPHFNLLHLNFSSVAVSRNTTRCIVFLDEEQVW